MATATLARQWRTSLVFMLISLYLPTAKATVYTATSSGSYTSTTVWMGNAAPPALLLQDTVIIPQGITISLDTNITTTKAGNLLEVNGTLNNSTSRILYIQNGALSGNGVIAVDSVLVISATWGFSGQLTTPSLSLGDQNMNTTASINVSQRLHLLRDSIKVNQGSLTIANNSTIRASLGILHQGTNGTINYPAHFYFLQNHYGVHNANPLLYHPNAQHITISLLSKDSGIKLIQDLTVDKILYLHSGRLLLNGHTLSFVDTAQLATQADGSIGGDTSGSIIIATHNGMSSGIPFYQDKLAGILDNHVKNFTINTTNKLATVHLPLGLVVHNKLYLQRGRIDIDFATLDIQPTGSINGGSDSSFILTSMGGGITQTVASNDSLLFPVGTPIYWYAPAMVTNKSNTANAFTVGVDSLVLSDGTTGTNMATLLIDCVEHSWLIKASDTNNTHVDLKLFWYWGRETPYLNNQLAYMSLYGNSGWESFFNKTAADISDPYYNNLTRRGVKKLGVFAIFGDSHLLVPKRQIPQLTTTLYPNPTSGNATLSLSLNEAQKLSIQLIDVAGRVVYTKEAKEYSSGKHNIVLPTTELPSGVYIYKLEDDKGKVLNSGRLVKE